MNWKQKFKDEIWNNIKFWRRTALFDIVLFVIIICYTIYVVVPQMEEMLEDLKEIIEERNMYKDFYDRVVALLEEWDRSEDLPPIATINPGVIV